MRPPIAVFDPGRDEFDWKLCCVRRKSWEIGSLGQSLQIAPRREDNRHLTAIGHVERVLRGRPEDMAVLGLLDSQLVPVMWRHDGIESRRSAPL